MNGFGVSDNAPPVVEAVNLRFLIRVFYAFAAMALLSLGISVAGSWFGRSLSMAGQSDSLHPYEIVIGNNVLTVPENTIRFEKARVGGEAQQLDVYFRWPTMEGYSRDVRDEFNNRGGLRTIIFASIEQALMSRDMSGRLEPIYKHVIEPAPQPGPADLQVYRFKPQSGYVNEMLMVGALPGGKAFVARCLTGPSAAESLAPCERDVAFGKGLSVTYRFPEALLTDWRQLDKAVMGRIGGFLRESR